MDWQQAPAQGFRLSPQQRQIWSLQAAEEQIYRSQCAVLVEGALDEDCLEAALRDAIQRHTILRAAFRMLPAMVEPLQCIGAPYLPSIARYDRSAQRAGTLDQDIDRCLHDLCPEPPDIEEGRPLAVSLVRLSADLHVLLLSLPALCADTASLYLLVQQLCAACQARTYGAAPAGKPVQYVDVAGIFNELLESQETRPGRDYWLNHPFLSIPEPKLTFEQTDARRRPFAPQSAHLCLDGDGYERVCTFVETNQTATAVLLLACWHILLARLAGQRDIVVGTVYDGRNYDGLEETLGAFARYIPISSSIRKNVRFLHVLRTIESLTDEVFDRQDFFQTSYLERSVDFDTDRPFFSFCFEYEADTADRTQQLSFTVARHEACIDRFKLKLSCVMAAEALTLVCAYDAGRFAHEQIEALLQRYRALLEAVVADPDVVVDQIEILTQQEKRKLFADFIDTQVTFQHGVCLHQLVEAQVQRSPDAVALVFDEHCLTYTALNVHANRLAHYLRRYEVGLGASVAICAERCPAALIAILAVLKAGAAYVPIDPAQPHERIAWLLHDSRATLVLAERRAADRLLDSPGRVVWLDMLREETARESGTNLAGDLPVDLLAYVIYTSGSSGVPKGVMVSHAAVCNRLLWGQSVYPLAGAARVLQSAPFVFDFSVWELFAPLLSGARVVMPLPGEHQDSQALCRLIARQHVSDAHFVPTLFQLILDEPGLAACGCLERVFCGGEPLPVELQTRFFARLDARLYNQYGPTEAAIDVTCWQCRRDDAARGVPIGRPIANVQTYVLDERLQPVPIGAAGELYIGGAALARGYLNQPGLTAERFIPNPFNDCRLQIVDCRLGDSDPTIYNLQSTIYNSARLYKTGDLVRYRDDGALEFLGRVDRQVKVRGIRIEPGEIEAALARHPAVRQAVVLARTQQSGARLVAHLLLHRGAIPTISELRQFLHARLPDFMIPATFLRLDSLPLLPSGKIDERALAQGQPGQLELAEAFVAPRTALEEVLCSLWADALQLPQISVHDNCFALGADSIIAMGVFAQLRQMFQVELPLRALFTHPTVADLSQAIGNQAAQPDQIEEVARTILLVSSMDSQEA